MDKTISLVRLEAFNCIEGTSLTDALTEVQPFWLSSNYQVSNATKITAFIRVKNSMKYFAFSDIMAHFLYIWKCVEYIKYLKWSTYNH